MNVLYSTVPAAELDILRVMSGIAVVLREETQPRCECIRDVYLVNFLSSLFLFLFSATVREQFESRHTTAPSDLAPAEPVLYDFL